MKVYDPVSNEWVDEKSEPGITIKKFNEMCNSCDNNNVYDFNTGKCRNWKDNKRVHELFEKEIEYCKLYNKAMKKAVSSDTKIVKNILDIKIDNGLKIKDIISAAGFSSGKFGKNLAKKLKIKNLRYAKYVNYIPVIISVLVSLNPDSREFVKKGIITITKTVTGGIAKGIFEFFIGNVKKNNFISKVASKFSFSKFVVFITGVISAFTNLGGKGNSDEESFSKVTRDVAEDYGFYDTVNYMPDSMSEYILSEYAPGSYIKGSSSINLRKLGLSSKEVSNDRLLRFEYSDPDSKVIAVSSLGKFPIIMSENERIKAKGILLKETDNLSNKVSRHLTDVKNSRMINKGIKTIESLKNSIHLQKETLQNLDRRTYEYRKASAKVKKESDELKKLTSQIPSYSEGLKGIDIEKIKKFTDLSKKITEIKQDFSKINNSNFNFTLNKLNDRIHKLKEMYENTVTGNPNVSLDQRVRTTYSTPAPFSDNFIQPVTRMDKLRMQQENDTLFDLGFGDKSRF